ncbi:MAG: tyrosine--tRNA ligase [Candidatus Omnitrophota bacterium]|nr:tyrosine--tRNA ligase [Candidatus Omnitrophota bacterium]
MDIQSQLSLIKRGIAEIISEEELIKKLKQNRPLVIKAGFDPTAPDIHLGHTVLLRKLRQFQDLGHVVYFLIGDFTAMIGDPTGVSQSRPTLSQKDIEKNAKTYKQQVFKILDAHKTKVVFNSEWFLKMSSAQLLNLSKYASVAQILARADFSQRFKENKNISLLEFFYPLLQAYDSVHLKADIELGGTDQKFNLLFGRQLQQDFKQEQQVVIMTPLLEGLDGVNKMSKSLGNYVGIQDEPSDMFGKIMSIADVLMIRYYELLTDEDLEAVKKLHPMEAKKKLSGLIVEQYWGKHKREQAKLEFEKVFQKGDFKEVEVKTFVKDVNGVSLLDLIDDTQVNLKILLVLKGKNDFRRLVAQGAVKVNGEKITDVNFLIKADGTEHQIQAGPKRFAKIILKPKE